jgi:hypothetical protein
VPRGFSPWLTTWPRKQGEAPLTGDIERRDTAASLVRAITGLGRHAVNTVRRSEMVASEATVEINMLPAVTVASR